MSSAHGTITFENTWSVYVRYALIGGTLFLAAVVWLESMGSNDELPVAADSFPVIVTPSVPITTKVEKVGVPVYDYPSGWLRS